MEITVYSASWCGPCKLLKPSLKREGIEFTNVDIDANLEATSKAGVRGVPTTVITDDDGVEVARIVGFSADTMKRIKEVLGIE